MSEKLPSQDSLSFFTTLYYIEYLEEFKVVSVTRETEQFIYGIIIAAANKKQSGKGFVLSKDEVKKLYDNQKIDFYKDFRDRTGFSL